MKEVTGSIRFLGIMEFLQVAMFNHRDLTLLLDNAAGKGAIVMDDGEVIHAVRDNALGVGALFPLLQGASEGTFRLVAPPKEMPERNIKLTTQQILMRVAMHLPPVANPNECQPDWSFEGDAGILSVVELLRIFETSRRPAQVVFAMPDGEQPSVVLAAGGIVSAVAGNKTGPDALFPLIAAEDISFRCSSPAAPPEYKSIFDTASVVMEALRRLDEGKMIRKELSVEENPHAQETLARLVAGELDITARLQLARRYMPGGEPAPAFVVAKLCADPEVEVRQAALETLEDLPEPILEVFATDEETPPPLLRYLLLEKKSPALASAVITNPKTLLSTLVAYAPKAKHEDVFEAFVLRKELLQESRELRQALRENKHCPFIKELDTLDKLSRPRLRKRKFTVIIQKPKYADEELVLEKPPSDPNKEKVQQRIGPRELGFIAKRGSLRQKKGIVCSNEDDLAVEVVSQGGIPLAFIQSVAESNAANGHALKYIASQPSYKRDMNIVRPLIFNPKTPVSSALGMLTMLRTEDLTKLAGSRDVADAVRQGARQLLAKKNKKH